MLPVAHARSRSARTRSVVEASKLAPRKAVRPKLFPALTIVVEDEIAVPITDESKVLRVYNASKKKYASSGFCLRGKQPIAGNTPRVPLVDKTQNMIRNPKQFMFPGTMSMMSHALRLFHFFMFGGLPWWSNLSPTVPPSELLLIFSSFSFADILVRRE